MKVKVKFLYHEGNNDLFAYFPELNWNNTSKRCYSGNEQHANWIYLIIGTNQRNLKEI